MSNLKDSIIECECEECDAEFDICVSDSFDEEPLYCPFCGSELPEEDMYEDDDDDFVEENYDFDDDVQ
jgi:hypothetical protein